MPRKQRCRWIGGYPDHWSFAPEDGEAGTVCQVLQKGYRIGDKVLRHAMVKVVPE